jgi:hypothetical protein
MNSAASGTSDAFRVARPRAQAVLDVSGALIYAFSRWLYGIIAAITRPRTGVAEKQFLIPYPFSIRLGAVFKFGSRT